MPYGTLAADYLTNSSGLSASTNPPGFRNRLINGAMQVWQRATGATTVTAGTAVPTASTGYYTADRWFIYSVGANATAARVSGTGNSQYNLQVTGAASMTNIGVGQRIEAANSYDLAGDTMTLSVQMANTLLTTVNWTINYANSTDAFGTIGTATKTLISNGSWTVTSTLATYTATVTIPAAATTGLEVLFTVGSQTSGTWTIGSAQLEIGSYATSFDYRPITTELALCQRYYFQKNIVSTSESIAVFQAYSTSAAFGKLCDLPVTMRTTPTGLLSAIGSFKASNGAGSSSAVFTGGTIDSVSSTSIGTTAWTGTSGLAAGSATVIQAAANSWIAASAEIA